MASIICLVYLPQKGPYYRNCNRVDMRRSRSIHVDYSETYQLCCCGGSDTDPTWMWWNFGVTVCCCIFPKFQTILLNIKLVSIQLAQLSIVTKHKGKQLAWLQPSLSIGHVSIVFRPRCGHFRQSFRVSPSTLQHISEMSRKVLYALCAKSIFDRKGQKIRQAALSRSSQFSKTMQTSQHYDADMTHRS